MPPYLWIWKGRDHETIGGYEEEETLEANGEEEPIWPMPVNEERSIVSPVVKKGTMLKTVPKSKEEEEREPKLTLSTSIPKKTHCMKEAKLKEVEWP
jgi:hypothetical protein